MTGGKQHTKEGEMAGGVNQRTMKGGGDGGFVQAIQTKEAWRVVESTTHKKREGWRVESSNTDNRRWEDRQGKQHGQWKERESG